MGKVQSKRSMDISTEPKDVIEEGTGKVGKIEDIDQQPQVKVNGDTHHENDVSDKEKNVSAEGAENEKDLATEKEQKCEQNGDGDAGNKTLENGNDDTLNESKLSEGTGSPEPANTTTTTTTEAAPAADSNKKPKKEKVKKKWSFRSISFSKKDKQKPAKKEEPANGECEKVPEEATEETATAAAAAAAAVAAAPSTEPVAANVTVSTDDKPKDETVAAVAEETLVATVEEFCTKSIEEKVESAAVQNVTEETKETSKPVEPVIESQNVEPIAAIPEPAVVEEPKVESVVESVVESMPEASPAPAPAPIVEEVTPPAAVFEEEVKKVDEPKVDEIKEEPVAEPEVKKQDDIKTETENIVNESTQSAQNIVTPTEQTVGEVGDSTPPPLPSIPPPSKVMVFAESAMSASNENDIPIPITENPQTILVDSQSVDVGSNQVAQAVDVIADQVEKVPEIEVTIKDTVVPVEEIVNKKEVEVVQSAPAPEDKASPIEAEVLAPAKEPEMLVAAPVDIKQEIVEEITEKIETHVTETSAPIEVVGLSDEPKQEQIAETIALIDKVNEAALSSSDDSNPAIDDTLPPPPPLATQMIDGSEEVKQTIEDATELSIDVSSPLPQNSLETLPSPPMSSSLSPSEASLPPPPPLESPITSTEITSQPLEQEQVTLATGIEAVPPPSSTDETEKTQVISSPIQVEIPPNDDNELPPPPPSPPVETPATEINVTESKALDASIPDEIKTIAGENVAVEEQKIEEKSIEQSDTPQNNVTEQQAKPEKTNGVAESAETSATESLNGHAEIKEDKELIPEVVAPVVAEKANVVVAASTPAVTAE